jgi:proteasome lid subunit RPN8/RPN11
VRIARPLLEQVVAHARRDVPNECVGLVAGRGGVARRVHPAENAAASPLRFEVDGPALLRLLDTIDADGDRLQAVYHSHTRTEAYPSQTDVNFAAGWPGLEWLIVGLREARPEVRAFRIEGGEVRETEVLVG